jgi:hypothetical protein
MTVQQNYRPQQNYQDRYRRNGDTIVEKLYSSGPYIIAIVSFLIATFSLVALLVVDLITGAYAGEYMANPSFGWFFSFGTTGVSLASIGLAMYSWRERWNVWLTIVLLLVSFVPIGIDIYFDGMAVDIIRFGHFILVEQDLSAAEKLPHQLFRIMVGALSAVGEPLAATSVIVFPVLKELFRGVFTQ